MAHQEQHEQHLDSAPSGSGGLPGHPPPARHMPATQQLPAEEPPLGHRAVQLPQTQALDPAPCPQQQPVGDSAMHLDAGGQGPVALGGVDGRGCTGHQSVMHLDAGGQGAMTTDHGDGLGPIGQGSAAGQGPVARGSVDDQGATGHGTVDGQGCMGQGSGEEASRVRGRGSADGPGPLGHGSADADAAAVQTVQQPSVVSGQQQLTDGNLGVVDAVQAAERGQALGAEAAHAFEGAREAGGVGGSASVGAGAAAAGEDAAPARARVVVVEEEQDAGVLEQAQGEGEAEEDPQAAAARAAAAELKRLRLLPAGELWGGSCVARQYGRLAGLSAGEGGGVEHK